MIMTKSKCRNVALLAVACTLATGVGCAVPPTGNGESGGTNNVPDTVPNFDAAIFTSPTRIDNTFFPQIPGTTRTYQAETEDGTTYSCLQTRDFTPLEPEVIEY